MTDNWGIFLENLFFFKLLTEIKIVIKIVGSIWLW